MIIYIYVYVCIYIYKYIYIYIYIIYMYTFYNGGIKVKLECSICRAIYTMVGVR